MKTTQEKFEKLNSVLKEFYRTSSASDSQAVAEFVYTFNVLLTKHVIDDEKFISYVSDYLRNEIGLYINL